MATHRKLQYIAIVPVPLILLLEQQRLLKANVQ